MKQKEQRGAQAVEFALMLPFFLVLLLLTIDFGFLVYNKAVITNASREAARSGSVLTAVTWDPAKVAKVACDYAKNSLISTSSGDHTLTCSGSADPLISVAPISTMPPQFGDPVTVTVNYTYQGFLSTFMGTTIESPWNLVAVSSMNHE